MAAAWGRRVLAGLCLLVPPLWPVAIGLWWWARRAEQKAEQQAQQAADISATKRAIERDAPEER